MGFFGPPTAALVTPRELFPGNYPAIEVPRSIAHTGTAYPAN
jgi:hypothetical protein